MGAPPYVDGHGLLAGKVVVVTAAAGAGIGSAVATRAVEEGATVVVSDVHERRLAEAADALEALGGSRPLACLCDVRDEAQVQNLLDAAVAEHGRLDVLVNNAGASVGHPIDHDDFEEAWDFGIDLLLTSLTRTIRAALPHLRQAAAGRIVNISSTEGVGGSANISAYTAAKHGVIGLTRSLAVELGESGITVNAVCPGPIHTGITSAIPEEMKAKFARRTVPVRRYGEPEEIAHGILHLALPASSYITGHALLVDGGMTIKNN